VSAHFNQFSVSGGIAKKRCSISQVIWFATVWEIGKKEIIGFLIIKNARFFRLLIRLNLSLLGGWRRGLLHFPSIIMAGGLIRSQCWADAKSFFFLVHVQVLIVNTVWLCCFSLVHLVLGRTLFLIIYSILTSSKKKC